MNDWKVKLSYIPKETLESSKAIGEICKSKNKMFSIVQAEG